MAGTVAAGKVVVVRAAAATEVANMVGEERAVAVTAVVTGDVPYIKGTQHPRWGSRT